MVGLLGLCHRGFGWIVWKRLRLAEEVSLGHACHPVNVNYQIPQYRSVFPCFTNRTALAVRMDWHAG